MSAGTARISTSDRHWNGLLLGAGGLVIGAVLMGLGIWAAQLHAGTHERVVRGGKFVWDPNQPAVAFFATMAALGGVMAGAGLRCLIYNGKQIAAQKNEGQEMMPIVDGQVTPPPSQRDPGLITLAIAGAIAAVWMALGIWGAHLNAGPHDIWKDGVKVVEGATPWKVAVLSGCAAAGGIGVGYCLAMAWNRKKTTNTEVV
jgi:hypothetical protein